MITLVVVGALGLACLFISCLVLTFYLIEIKQTTMAQWTWLTGCGLLMLLISILGLSSYLKMSNDELERLKNEAIYRGYAEIVVTPTKKQNGEELIKSVWKWKKKDE